ncbi:MAG: ISL3 family transposase [Opitutales bacterium]|nr:ISL3 family transposase [Opitutales bacterium]
MKPEVLFRQLLGLGEHWFVSSVEYSTGELRLVIEERPSLVGSLKCAADGAPVSCHDHGEKRIWRHLNVFEHVCYIECRLPRVRCSWCGKVTTVKAPWEGRLPGLTLLFEAFALTLMREMPVRAASRFLGEHDTRLWRLLKAYVDESYRDTDFGDVQVVGCDELSARKGRQYVSVFADMQKRRVIYATPGRDASTWDAFAEELPRHGASPAQVQEVSIDMSSAYAFGARKHCPQATIVWDRFHVMKNVGNAVEAVRQMEHRHRSRQGDKSLGKTMWLWRHNPEDLRPEEAAHLERLSEANLLTAKAWQMRQTLCDLYELPSKDAFRSKLKAWCRWVRMVAARNAYIFEPMIRAAKMVRTHMDGIVAFVSHRTTNAFMEGLMSVFSAVKRKARGFRSTANLIAMIYFTAGKLNLPAVT